MAVATVGTMLDCAQEFQGTLERFLAGVRDTASNDNVRLLTYYLARFKNQLPDTEGIFTDEQLQLMRTVPLRIIDSEFVPDRCFDGRYLSPDASVDELLETATELAGILLSFYQWLLHQPTSNEARGLLDRLIKTQENSLEKLKKIQETKRF
jgi:hypothetical protein